MKEPGCKGEGEAGGGRGREREGEREGGGGREGERENEWARGETVSLEKKKCLN